MQDRRRLHYTVSGVGNPVVFLHGFMEDSSMWADIVPGLQNRTCIAIDLHGHGQSFFNEQLIPSITAMAEQVSEMLHELKVKTFTVVGHSLGGYVACELLKTNPGTAAIVLFHSHPWADSDAKKLDRDRVAELVKTKASFFIREAIPHLFAYPENHPEAIEAYCSLAEKMNPSAIGWSTLAMRNRTAYTDLVEKHPTRISLIQGQRDPIIPNIALRELAAEHGLSWNEIPDCGHMGQVEAPEKVISLLNSLLG